MNLKFSPLNALTCTGLNDATCNTGNFLLSGVCTACSAGTATCSSATVSLTCNSGFFFGSNVCTACGYIYYFISEFFIKQKIIYYRTVNVITCTATAATSCIPGFFIAVILFFNSGYKLIFYSKRMLFVLLVLLDHKHVPL